VSGPGKWAYRCRFKFIGAISRTIRAIDYGGQRRILWANTPILVEKQTISIVILYLAVRNYLCGGSLHRAAGRPAVRFSIEACDSNRGACFPLHWKFSTWNCRHRKNCMFDSSIYKSHWGYSKYSSCLNYQTLMNQACCTH